MSCWMTQETAAKVIIAGRYSGPVGGEASYAPKKA
jgi:hypothetical protein